MKLTYRGINYTKKKLESQQLCSIIPTVKYRLRRDRNKIILIKPIHYCIYRGVSYTRNLAFDTKTKLLLNIERE